MDGIIYIYIFGEWVVEKEDVIYMQYYFTEDCVVQNKGREK